MRRSSTLTVLGIAVAALPLAAACATSPTVDMGGDNGSSSSSGGSGGNGGNSSGSSGGNGGSSSSSTTTSSGGKSSSSSGSGGTTSSSGSGTTSSSGSGTASSSSGSGTTSSSSGSGTTSSSSGGGGTDAGATSACGTPSAVVISDFEQNSGALATQPGRNGWWFEYTTGTNATALMPPANPTGPIGAVASSAASGDTQLAPGDTCNHFALASSYPGPAVNGAGLGASFGATKAVYSVAAYDGIKFDIQNVSGNQPLWFEMVMTDTQEMQYGGIVPNTGAPRSQDTNTRGYYLTGAGGTAGNTSTVLPGTMSTVYVPFSLLLPRRLPNDAVCNPGIPCESPPFIAAHGLGFQFSAYPDMNNTAQSWNVMLDNVEFYTGDNGLVPGNPTAAPPAFNDGAAGFASCKGAIPTFASGKYTAAGKYLLWAYNSWKHRFFVGGTVIRPENGNDTVSEGIGYGMLLAVYFNDQATFDTLWNYEQGHLATGNLMTWCIPSGGGSCNASGGTATDADEDMAFALLQAGKRTGWSTAAKYAGLAPTVISQVWTADIDTGTNLPKGGSNYGPPTGNAFPNITNPSYFAPGYYRKAFAAADPGHPWASLADHTIAVVAALGAGTHGLVPAWCGGGAGCTTAESNGASTDMIYQYDAHRVPWRMGLDYCWNGTAAAQSYLSTISGFFNGVYATTGTGIDSIFDLYNLNGTKCTAAPCTIPAVENSASVIGTAAVGAMSGGATYANFVSSAWQFVLDSGNRASLDVSTTGTPSIYSYFNATVGLLTALTMSGNFYPM